MELVSAIITTHNRSALLTRAIESVLSQTYGSIECIVVDDASSDDTKKKCKSYPVNYIFIPKDESHGGNYARNLGIKAAKGKYCAFLDDDDYWMPTKIEKQVSLIEEKGCELVYCGKRNEIVKLSGIVYNEVLPDIHYQGMMSKKILTDIRITTSDVLILRQALVDVGLFDENLRFWQEYELTIRLAQRKPFYFVNEALTVYRVDLADSQRLTNKYYEWINAVKYIHKKHKVLYRRQSFLDKLKTRDLFWRDAKKRSKASGLAMHYYYYYVLTFIGRCTKKMWKNVTL